MKATGEKGNCVQRNKELGHTSHQKLCKPEDNGVTAEKYLKKKKKNCSIKTKQNLSKMKMK